MYSTALIFIVPLDQSCNNRRSYICGAKYFQYAICVIVLFAAGCVKKQSHPAGKPQTYLYFFRPEDEAEKVDLPNEAEFYEGGKGSKFIF